MLVLAPGTSNPLDPQKAVWCCQEKALDTCCWFIFPLTRRCSHFWNYDLLRPLCKLLAIQPKRVQSLIMTIPVQHRETLLSKKEQWSQVNPYQHRASEWLNRKSAPHHFTCQSSEKLNKNCRQIAATAQLFSPTFHHLNQTLSTPTVLGWRASFITHICALKGFHSALLILSKLL